MLDGQYLIDIERLLRGGNVTTGGARSSALTREQLYHSTPPAVTRCALPLAEQTAIGIYLGNLQNVVHRGMKL